MIHSVKNPVLPAVDEKWTVWTIQVVHMFGSCHPLLDAHVSLSSLTTAPG